MFTYKLPDRQHPIDLPDSVDRLRILEHFNKLKGGTFYAMKINPHLLLLERRSGNGAYFIYALKGRNCKITQMRMELIYFDLSDMDYDWNCPENALLGFDYLTRVYESSNPGPITLHLPLRLNEYVMEEQEHR